ncbi:MAG: hypothetical protein IJN07_06315 [Clostridia bacterium]|nr:hypothetical protein [Clostridia bacterium]
MKNNVLIFGDSYSTFEGYVPDGYAIYYSENENPETDVRNVKETWWYQVIQEKNFNLILNNSWSGSTISYTGYDNVDCSKSSSFIYRLKQLIESDFFVKNRIDKVFVFGGTNDNWSNAPLGEMKYSDWENDELYSVLPAICYFLNLLKKTLPHADIYCLINTELKPEITSCMKKACEKYGTTPITFSHIDKSYGHPTVQGMKDIKEAILKVMNK